MTSTMTTEMVNTMRSTMGTTAGMMTIGILVAASLALAVLLLVAKWKLFTKMGEKGWKSLIPIYSEYLMFKNVWSGKAFLATFLVGAALEIGSRMALYTTGAAQIAGLAIAAVMLVATVVISVKFACKLAKCFGHGAGYAVGLIFAEPLFTMILGLGKSEYARA